MTKQDEISAFVKSNAGGIIVFCAFLVLGLTVGIISALKPADPFAALAAHNEGIFSVIENASYMQFLFTSLASFFTITLLSSLFGRYSYSAVLLVAVMLVLGYFQGGTVIFVVRVYGVISLPLAICYSILSLFADVVLCSIFARLVGIAKERRKYGCKTSFVKTLVGSAFPMLAMVIALTVRFFLVVAFSFFL